VSKVSLLVLTSLDYLPFDIASTLLQNMLPWWRN